MHNNPVKNEDREAYVRSVNEWAKPYGYVVFGDSFGVSVYVATCNLSIHKRFNTGEVIYKLYTFPESVSQFLHLQAIITQYTLSGE